MTAVGLDISGLDPAFKSHALRGIGRYVAELRNFFGGQSGNEIAVDYFDHAQLMRGGISPKIIDALPCGRTTIRQQFLYPFRLRSKEMRRFSFLHFPAHMDAPAWSTTPYVLTVLDLIPLVLSDLYKAHRPSWRFHFARWLELRAIKNATVCLAISECTARDLTRILGIPPERIRITPLGVDGSFFNLFERRRVLAGAGQPGAGAGVRCRLGIPEGRPIVLYVGGHDERKNIRRLVAIVQRVIAAWSGPEGTQPMLVLAGKISSAREESELATALWDYSMAADTVSLGFVPDEDLKALYAESSVFLFPSLYEGFGLPCLEAMAAGLPVVCSDTSSMPEVVGSEGLFFDPLNVDAGAELVSRLLADSELWQRQSVTGFERAHQFTWQRTGELTSQAYGYAASLLAGGRTQLNSGASCSLAQAEERGVFRV